MFLDFSWTQVIFIVIYGFISQYSGERLERKKWENKKEYTLHHWQCYHCPIEIEAIDKNMLNRRTQRHLANHFPYGMDKDNGKIGS